MATDTAKLDELLAGLAEYAGESKDKVREVALKLLDKDETKAIGEVLLKKGLGKRTAEATGKASELEVQLKETRDELAEARNQIKELEAKEPNWTRRIEDNNQSWQKKLDTAEQKAREERKIRVADKVSLERKRFEAALRIGQEGGVEAEYGALLPAQYTGNFAPDEDSNTVKVRELGEQDSYYDAAEGEPSEQLARDVLAKVPPKYRILGDPVPGGGAQGGRPIDKAMSATIAAKRNDPLYGGGF